MIMFQTGSGRYDPEAEIFHLDARDPSGHVDCEIDRAAFEGVTRSSVTQATAEAQFAKWEGLMIRLVEQKYARVGANDAGAVSIGADDVREFWFP
jgi:hypothetical protein